MPEAERDKQKLLEKARKRFKQALEAEQRQRERERDDLRFQVPEFQWDESARRQRLGTAVEGVPTPARPILSIPKLDQPVQLVLNQERAAHLGVNIHPLSPDADDEVAEVIQGLYRRIERDSQARIARSWAFDRAAKCGRGAYRVNTRYDEEGGDPFDQAITIERILHQDAVYFDPAAQKPDFSDGEWAFIVSWVRVERFKEMYPDASVSGAELLDFEGMLSEAPEWVKGDDEERAVLVAEYYYKEHQTVCLCRLEDGSTLPLEDVPTRSVIVTQRNRDVVSVKWCKLTGFEILEQEDWNGKLIPLIPVIGKELQPFDSERRWYGIITPAKDAQRLYNYAASSAVELAALEPRAPWIIAEGQDEGWESEWQQSNTRNLPALHYKPTALSGQPVPPPARVQVDVSRLGPSMALLQEADQFIQSATATFDPALGRLNQKERSGRAIIALQDQADAGSSHYLHNLADVSMAYEAKVVLDLIPVIYDRPGRLARTLDLEDESKTVILNSPFVRHPKTGRPIPLPSEAGGAMVMPNLPPGSKVETYDLRKGIYSVSVSIGKSYQTRLQHGADEIGELLAARPELMSLIGPIYFKYRDFPGAREIGELMAKVREKQFPGVDGNGDGQGPTPEQAQAAIQAMQQQMQLMQAQLQAAIKAIETDQVKQQAMLMKAQMDNATKERIADKEQETKILLQTLTEKFDAAMAALGHVQEKKAAEFKAAHEVATAAMEQIGSFTGPNEVPLGREDEI